MRITAAGLYRVFSWLAATLSLLGSASPSLAQNPIRINAGGPSYTDSLGRTWSADSGANTGTTTTATATVTGSIDAQLYRTERYDPPAAPALVYTLSVPNGTHVVRLYMAETYTPTKGAGLRVFSVDVQGVRTFQDVDIFVQAGGADKELMLQTTAMVSNGQLTIGFVNQVQHAKINAIEVIPTSLRINAGSTITYVDSAGYTWVPDYGANTGTTTTATATVTGTADPQLFKTERYDPVAAPAMSYSLPLLNGTYTVRLHVAETYAPTKGAGLRLFSVDIQGTRAFQDVDIFVQAGGADKALVLQAPATVTNGQLVIGFVNQVQHPKVNAIEVLPDVAPFFTSFESNQGYSLGSLGGQGGWTTSGSVTVASGGASAGTQLVKLAGSSPTAWAQRSFTAALVPTVTYLDFFLKPVFTGALDNSSYLDVTSAQIGFVASGAVGRIQVLTTNLQGSPHWLSVGPSVQLDSNQRAVNWQRATLRLDYTAGEWDLFWNGQIVASALPLNSSHTHLPGFLLYGSSGGDTLFDDIFAGPSNPLPPDTSIPTIPSALASLSSTSSSINLFWAPSSGSNGVAGYKIYRNGTLVATVSGLQTYFTDQGLNASTSYTYTVQAFNSSGVASGQSSGVTLATTASTAPSLEVFSPLK